MQAIVYSNHAAERVEINSRVNYPVKHVLRVMVNANELNIDDPVTRNSRRFSYQKMTTLFPLGTLGCKVSSQAQS